MNPEEAKRILAAYRPGSRDAEDPQVAAALEQVQHDPTLKSWFERHTAFQNALQESFRKIPLPGNLTEQILSPLKVVKPVAWWQQPVGWAAAASVMLLITLSILWPKTPAGNSFLVYRDRMSRTAQRDYRMDIATNDMAQIRQFLAKNRAPADYELSEELTKLAPMGARLMSWQGRRVSMVCFDSRERNAVFLFVVDRSVAAPPPPRVPVFLQVNKLMTASWTQGDNVYVLAAPGNIQSLRKYIP